MRYWLDRIQYLSGSESAFTDRGIGGPCRARTYDPLIKSQLLCQLS